MHPLSFKGYIWYTSLREGFLPLCLKIKLEIKIFYHWIDICRMLQHTETGEVFEVLDTYKEVGLSTNISKKTRPLPQCLSTTGYCAEMEVLWLKPNRVQRPRSNNKRCIFNTMTQLNLEAGVKDHILGPLVPKEFKIGSKSL